MVLRTAGQWTMYVGMAVSVAFGATWPRPTWWGVALGLLIIAAGIVLRRVAGAPPLEPHRASSEAADTASANVPLHLAIAEFSAGVEALAKEAPTVDADAVKTKIGALMRLGPDRLGAAQEAVVARVGFPVYAEVMAPLATAERLLYRAWSAASDGHAPEMLSSLEAACAPAREARALAEAHLRSLAAKESAA